MRIETFRLEAPAWIAEAAAPPLEFEVSVLDAGCVVGPTAAAPAAIACVTGPFSPGLPILTETLTLLTPL